MDGLRVLVLELDPTKSEEAIERTPQGGDVLLLSEATVHTGLPKTTDGVRTNLYYNYIERSFNGMTFSPLNNYHFCMPPSIRARFDETQKELTEWMELFIADETPPAAWIRK